MGFDAHEPMVFGDDEPLPPAEPFPRADGEIPVQREPEPSAQPSHESTTTTTAEAPQRRVRQAKQLQVDDRAEISNRQLGEWSANYLANMNAISRTKEQNKSAAQAKKNAVFWVLRQGIGGVETNFGNDLFPHPLAVFSGRDLLDALTGRDSSPTGSKRTRSQSLEADDEEEGRRVRAKGEDGEEVVRGEGDIVGFDDDGILLQEDDYNIESEVGRQAPSSLREQSSAMPWNISSRGGSVQRFGSAGRGMSSSVAGAGALPLGPQSALSRRGSRLTSASPLVGKGSRLPSIAVEDDEAGLEEQGSFPGDDDMGLGGEMDVDDYELYGPSAAVDTQTAAQSQWLKTTLENEAFNFLAFLEKQLQKREERGEEEGEADKSITLDELLPPANNTQVVGAQAMLHVLALTTKGLIEVEQEEAFGDIRMWVVHASSKSGNGHDEEME
jgi:meiotic recombination protein REC8, fungi type